MAVTIRDVAREAGVSVATVSHALTGYTDISVKTRQKIQEHGQCRSVGFTACPLTAYQLILFPP